MKTPAKRVLCIVTALAVSNWFAVAADMNGAPRANDQNSSLQTTPGDQGSASTPMPPQEFNKASGIVGMDVQNEQGEHLGHIKDIVFDLKTQRISYAVLTTASKAMPINEKLLAVPLNAFTVSTDQKHLILNADKQKVETAAGFSSKTWPNVGNPTWGAEPFWQQNNEGSGTMKSGSTTPNP